jgi:hypothetical protein
MAEDTLPARPVDDPDNLNTRAFRRPATIKADARLLNRSESFALGEARLDDFLALAPQMRVQDMGEPAAIAPLQRVQDSLVLLDRKCPMLCRHRGDEPSPPYPRGDRFIEAGEHRVVGSANDGLVDQAVAAIIRQQILRAKMLDHVRLQIGNFTQLLVGDAGARGWREDDSAPAAGNEDRIAFDKNRKFFMLKLL